MVDSRTCHPQNLQSSELWCVQGWQVLDYTIFLVWQVLDFTTFGGGQFRTLLFFWILAHSDLIGRQSSQTVRHKVPRVDPHTHLQQTAQLFQASILVG